MPCYDKKLEAVRDDFVFSVEDKEITEVDSVLTTGEVLDLIQVTKLFPATAFI
jgi:iron only hydrogenase large subunit-like protein